MAGDLWTIAEVLAHTGIHRNTLAQHRERTMPAPVKVLPGKQGALYDAGQIRAWWADVQARKTGRTTQAQRALELRRAGESISGIARELDVHRNTVRRWLDSIEGNA